MVLRSGFGRLELQEHKIGSVCKEPSKEVRQGNFGMALFNGAIAADLKLGGPENPTWPHLGR